ncbi:MAG: glycosyltransferase family 2 protein [Candidatus Thiodiazotropha sp.]
MPCELSIVVPVLNESGNIEPLLSEIHAALPTTSDFEVIYVDDGSQDETSAELARAASRYPGLRVLRHQKTCGQSRALCNGIKSARGTWIATLDGDGQNDPGDIPKLLEIATNARQDGTPVLIAGYRVKRRDTWIKRISSRVANGIRSRLLGDDTPDTGCGLKVIAREDFLQLPFFDHMHRFLPALVLRSGGRVISEQVNHRERTRGQSKYGTLDRLIVGVSDLMGVMWLQRRGSHTPYTETRHGTE